MHPLDQSIWSALSTHHVQFAQGSDLAKRYDGGVLPFADVADDAPENWQEMANLLSPRERCLLIRSTPLCVTNELEVEPFAGVQMVAASPLGSSPSPEVISLGHDNIGDILSLAGIAKPGPVTRWTPTIGRYWGIRAGTDLVAMAGERFSHPGFVEISSVCTHPDYRGRGLAKKGRWPCGWRDIRAQPGSVPSRFHE